MNESNNDTFWHDQEKQILHKRKNQKLVDRITEYLLVGGLFNPELMEHSKVRDLLIDCREQLNR